MLPILQSGFAALGLELTEAAARRFSIYFSALEEKNKVMNLTAITGEEEVARLHFLDCAALCSLRDLSGRSVIDVGSGAGFPGIPMKIVCPSMELTLLDSTGKKVDFLREVCRELGFEDVACVHGRAEEQLRLFSSFDYAVSRAVARLNVLCELCLPFVRKGGEFIAMKGSDYTAELSEAKKALSFLGGGRTEVKSYSIPGADRQTHAIFIEKKGVTPEGYPRQYSKIKKAPL